MTDTALSFGLDTRFQQPALLDGARLSAWVEYGRRKLSWTLNRPDGAKIGAAPFVWLWIEVSETAMLSGEPRGCYATRRVTDSSARDALPPKAAKMLSDLLLDAVARYGFDRLWLETFQTNIVGQTARAERNIALCKARAEWWERTAEIARMFADGALTMRPAGNDDRGRGHRIGVVADNGQFETRSVVAQLWLGDEHVGWLDDSTNALPHDLDYLHITGW